MKFSQILLAFTLIALAYSACDFLSKNEADCQKGTSGDIHCCWTITSNAEGCLQYDKAAYDAIAEAIKTGKKSYDKFDIKCSSSFLKIGVFALVALLF